MQSNYSKPKTPKKKGTYKMPKRKKITLRDMMVFDKDIIPKPRPVKRRGV